MNSPWTKYATVRNINFLVAVLVILRCAWIFSLPLRSADPLGLAEDDFYYYLKPAQNLAWFHESAAFNHTLTNGYHPLYFAVLTLVSLLVRTVPGIYRFLWALDTTSAAAIFLVTRRLFSSVTSNILANAFAVAVTGLCVSMICCQMEVTLAIPLGFAFLLSCFVSPPYLTSKRAGVIGILGALTFLSRLDTGILVSLSCLGMLCTGKYRTSLTRKKVLSFLAAFAPLPLLYFWINFHFFHSFLPVSGAAKQLRSGSMPSVLLFRTFLGTDELLANVAVAGVVLAFALRRHLLSREKVFVFAVLLYPFAFFGILTLISDWPVWPWYFYVLRFSTAGMAMLLGITLSRARLLTHYPRFYAAVQSSGFTMIVLVASCGRLLTLQYHVNWWMSEIQSAARVLVRFAQAHPGAYAMGDRAGVFMISTQQPVLQAEGLIMDRDYLSHIRAQDNLNEVLRSYGVTYYVAFVPKQSYDMQFSNGCFHAMEPFLAGPLTKRMRADFCGEPFYTFSGSDGIYVIYRVTD